MDIADNMSRIEIARHRFLKIDKFFYSNYYFLLLLAITFLCWFFDLSVIGMLLLSIVAMVSLIINDDMSPVLPIMPLMVMVVSRSDFLRRNINIAIIALVVLILAGSFIFNIVYYKQKLKKGRMTIPLLLVSLALFIGGFLSKYMNKYLDGFIFALSLGPMLLIIYTFAVSMVRVPRYVDTKLYFAKMVSMYAVYAALLVVVAHLRMQFNSGLDRPGLIDHTRAMLDVGWGNRAGLAIILVLSLGSVFYFADNNKGYNFALYHFGFLMYIALVCTTGRGGILFGTLEMILISIYLLRKGKHRLQYLIALSMWLLLGFVVIILMRHMLIDILDKFNGLTSNGRDKLFMEGIGLFAKYPLFGVGLGYRGDHYFAKECIYWFHNTPVQILASMGLFGLVCYAIWYYNRAKVMFAKKDPYTIMIFITMLCFEVHSLIDSGNFQPLPFLYIVIMLDFFVEYSHNEDRVYEYATDDYKTPFYIAFKKTLVSDEEAQEARRIAKDRARLQRVNK